MLRNQNGAWVFYRAECKLGEKDRWGRPYEWFVIGDPQEAMVPSAERWRDGKLLEPWRAHSAAGDTWQALGEFGVQEAEMQHAIAIKERLERAHKESSDSRWPDMRFRVVRVVVSQFITELK